MPLDESIVYYWTSLGLSAAAIFVFLWLVREPPKALPPTPVSRVDRAGAEQAPGAPLRAEALENGIPPAAPARRDGRDGAEP